MARILPSLGRLFATETNIKTKAGPSYRQEQLSRWTDPKIAVPLAKLAVTAGSNIYNDWQQDTINENAVADLRKRQRSAGLAGLLGAASHLKPEQGSEYDGYREALTEYNRRGTEIQLDRVREQALAILDDPNVGEEQKNLIREHLFPEGTGLKGALGMQGGPSWMGVAPQPDPERTLYTGPGSEEDGAYRGKTVGEVARMQANIATPEQAFEEAARAKTLNARKEAEAILSRAYRQGMGAGAKDFEDLMMGGPKARDEEELRRLFPKRFAPQRATGTAQRPGVNTGRIKQVVDAVQGRREYVFRLKRMAGNDPQFTVEIPYAAWKRHTGATLTHKNGSERDEAEMILVGIPVGLGGEERRSFVEKSSKPSIAGTKDEKWGLQLVQGLSQLRKAKILEESKELDGYLTKSNETESAWDKVNPGPLTSIPHHAEPALTRGFMELAKNNRLLEAEFHRMMATNPDGTGSTASTTKPPGDETAEIDKKKALGAVP